MQSSTATTTTTTTTTTSTTTTSTTHTITSSRPHAVATTTTTMHVVPVHNNNNHNNQSNNADDDMLSRLSTLQHQLSPDPLTNSAPSANNTHHASHATTNNHINNASHSSSNNDSALRALLFNDKTRPQYDVVKALQQQLVRDTSGPTTSSDEQQRQVDAIAHLQAHLIKDAHSTNAHGSASSSSPSHPSSLPYTIRRILHYCQLLNIDATYEFYLIPIAVYAYLQEEIKDLKAQKKFKRLEQRIKKRHHHHQQQQSSPSSSQGDTGALLSSDDELSDDDDAERDIAWYRELIIEERLRFEKLHDSYNGVHNSPWVQIDETQIKHKHKHAPSSSSSSAAAAASQHIYWYNFSTFRRSDTAPPAVLASKPAAPPAKDTETDLLRFTSWWCERRNENWHDALKKRHVKISYRLSTEEFEIEIEGENKVHRTKVIKNKWGNVSCWDLHIKATVDIFGRLTTLLQCDSDTRIWLETNAARLLKIKSSLQEKLLKYTNRILVPPTKSKPLVEHHLRELMKDVAKLKNELAVYRPTLAQKYGL